jgi:hypothetical protein
MIVKTGLAVAFGILTLSFAPPSAIADPDYLGGRTIVAYARDVQQEPLSGAPMRIGSKCYNGCVLKLGAANVEIAPDALLSAHVDWVGNRPEDMLNPALYAAMVPECARRVLDRPPYMTDPLHRVYGRDILAACPQMHAMRQ